MVDGYDELPAEYQEKIKFALENGHIPDEDCTRVSHLHLAPRHDIYAPFETSKLLLTLPGSGDESPRC
jgi:hypothetical protein